MRGQAYLYLVLGLEVAVWWESSEDEAAEISSKLYIAAWLHRWVVYLELHMLSNPYQHAC